ncbi:MAG: hypothetical protein KIS76_10015 [Pyrinomonadaceae bacterium]|nr:hypothetical protein [Pyrinomonadaceae bacterium]
MTETIFCHKCGKSDQRRESYCRGCGEYLNDPDKLRKRGILNKTPEENIKSSLVLSSFSGIVSIVMAVLLYATFLGKEGVEPIIYIAAALFTAIGIWQTFNVISTIKLKQHFAARKTGTREADQAEIAEPASKAQLNEPDFSDAVPMSVTERTTRELNVQKRNRSSHT